MSVSPTDGLASDVWRDVTSLVRSVWQQQEWADDEIRQAIQRHPSERDTLFHSFPILVATHQLMATEFVYRAHCRELLDRVIEGADTRPGTAAEVCCLCSDTSVQTPIRSAAAGLYLRMWTTAFPDHSPLADHGEPHEALESSTIDELEATARRRLRVRERMLTGISCSGRHHGALVQCKYVGA